LFITHDLDEAIYLADRILVLKAHPGEVNELIEVSVPRPRNFEQAISPEFLATKKRLENLIHTPADDEPGLSMVRMVRVGDDVEDGNGSAMTSEVD
jgi:NitT/TauT family transport system ATP-binding protein